MNRTDTDPDIEILYEDNHLLAISKPIGLLSQEDYSGDPDVLTLCKAYLKKKYNKPGNVYLGLLHRLDRPVSGVMILAKTSKAASRISEQIRKRIVKKRYLAIVVGEPGNQGVLTHYLVKNHKNNIVQVVSENTRNAKRAELMYRTLKTNDGLSLIQVSLITGRAHQIRVQFAEVGTPLWGDQKYGKRVGSEIALHAYQFEMNHPTLKKTQMFQSNPPKSHPWNQFELPNIL